ncbi:MAG TPA: deoxynucleoside kinase [Nevskiaceae bacterium]|nr:deoxynucleoside kinase [Nevskiaceae bacterium]
MRPGYIAIEGVIGAGKTTLAKKLARSLAANLLLEEPDENPFLPRFYRDPEGAAFSTQLTFLLQRAGQVEQLQQRDLFTSTWVADFMFDKDRLFAELTLGAADFALYDAVFQRLALELPRPDCIVHLVGPTDLLMTRIAERGRDYESDISPQYLQQLAVAYGRYFRSDLATRVVEVDTALVDFVGNDEDYRAVLDALDGTAPFERLPRGALL